MTHLAAFALGVACGIVATFWLISRMMGTPETTKVPEWVHDEEALPPYDPRVWQAVWERTK